MSFPSTSSPPASPLAPPADKADAWVPYVQRIQARQEAKQAAQERARAAAARGPFARALARLVPRKMRREGYAPAARGAGVEVAQDEDKKD